MKKVILIFLCSMLTSCIKEPKKITTVENEPVKIVTEEDEKQDEKIKTSLDKSEEDSKLLKFEEALNKSTNIPDETNNDNTITINNLEKFVNINSSERLLVLFDLVGFKPGLITDTNGNKEVLSNVSYNENNEFLCYYSDSNFSPIGTISFHPKNIKLLKMLKKECVDKGYTYDKNLKGNMAHTKVSPNDLIGYSNSLFTVYFSGVYSKEYIITVEKN